MRGGVPAFVSIARALAATPATSIGSGSGSGASGGGGEDGSGHASAQQEGAADCSSSNNKDSGNNSNGSSSSDNSNNSSSGGVKAQVAIVYIQEAHASDEWPIRSSRNAAPGRACIPISYQQHRDLPARLGAAADFASHYNLPLDVLPVLADGMGNAFQDAYAAWPIRWYIFDTRNRQEQQQRSAGIGGARASKIARTPSADGTGSKSAASNGGAEEDPDEVYLRAIGQPDDASFDLQEPLLLLGADPRHALVYEDASL